MSMSCAISDSDISGPGVRISFYLQSFLLVILVDRDEKLYEYQFMDFYCDELRIAEYANSALTLLEALQVSNLLWLANFGIFFALASYSRSKRKSHRKHKKSGSNGLSGNTKAKEERKESDYGVKTASMLQTLLSFALTLYMWANPEKFSDPPCVETLTYVLFAWKISILQNGRIVGLAFSTLLSCAYIAITLHEYWISYLKRKSKKTQTNEYSPLQPRTYPRLRQRCSLA
ncbi:hypothetical protein BDP27DRAFT_1415759 [Rhodocollybia butyracea]|uniref:Uncharacterized protein n=1 Tax=Rhodocollybia butyracea TaxID=206335 RepID=A0A9P5Q3L0_9AGAR|nr:hypothetical protein BDP27DRAFT_1415759 [Rhodocollybia butyracea]